ncbi:12841_t:CDS:2 [Entrophospora sp. SA101]|nr:2093_t:CDS:2 [Entrophospora sp. SA101]CAJ0765391.1 12841_t:CDS:2 [Entrophospora sp. SA101]
MNNNNNNNNNINNNNYNSLAFLMHQPRSRQPRQSPLRDQHTDKESQISFLHIHQVMQDLDNITNTIEDVDNLIDQTNNEPQGDGLLNSTEPSFSMQANDI